MVNFNPSISYSDEASDIFYEYRKLKEKQEKEAKNHLSEPIGYAMLNLELITDDVEGRVQEFHENNGSKLTSSDGIITREYHNRYLSGRSGEVFLTKSLIDFLELNPEHKIKVIGIYKGFAVVEIYSKAYIVPEELLKFVEHSNDATIGNELMVKTTNQVALKNELEETNKLIEKVSNFEDEAFTAQLAEINNLKAEMEAKLTAMYEMQAKMMAELQEKSKRYEHQFLIM